MNRFAKKILLLVPVLAVTAAQSASACATCYGVSDSPMAQGMNWGIVTLLGVVGGVLAAISLFFVHVGLRASKLGGGGPTSNSN